MIIRSKAPLRLGLAGGGTDVNPYSNMYGGNVLNATINMYAHCTIEEMNNEKIEFEAVDLNLRFNSKVTSQLKLDGNLDLHKGVYNRIIRDFNENKELSVKITTYSDAPPGSGLGSSSTMVVALLKAFSEYLSLPLGEYDIAQLAYVIEREDIGLSGGKQDQYASVFGGFNFMEFSQNDKVIVNPLRIKNWIKDELQARILLFYTGVSRSSAKIIDDKKRNTKNNITKAINAMHLVKQFALSMKEAVLTGDMRMFGDILDKSWKEKQKMSNQISNSKIDKIFETAIKNGAISGKVSGAGGGGFIMFFVDPVKKIQVKNSLKPYKGIFINFDFSEGGCHSWKIDK